MKADTNNQCVRRVVVSSGAVTTIAGTAGFNGYADGPGTAAMFAWPQDVAMDAAGTVAFIVSQLSPFLATFRTSRPRTFSPQTDQYNHCVRRFVVSTGFVYTLAGSGTRGYAEGQGTLAQFTYPSGVATDSAGSFVLIVS